MSTATDPTVEELREQLRCTEAERVQAQERVDELDREARRLRVAIAKARNGREHAPVDHEARLRDFLMGRELASEADVLEHLALPKAKLRTLAERLADEGKLVAMACGRARTYAWVRPDRDGSAPARREHRDPVVPMARRRGDSVSGTGKGRKLGASREVRQLTRKLEKQGAQVEKMGDGHIRISTDADVITMSATPRKKGLGKTKSQARNRLKLSA